MPTVSSSPTRITITGEDIQFIYTPPRNEPLSLHDCVLRDSYDSLSLVERSFSRGSLFHEREVSTRKLPLIEHSIMKKSFPETQDWYQKLSQNAQLVLTGPPPVTINCHYDPRSGRLEALTVGSPSGNPYSYDPLGTEMKRVDLAQQVCDRALEQLAINEEIGRLREERREVERDPALRTMRAYLQGTFPKKTF